MQESGAERHGHLSNFAGRKAQPASTRLAAGNTQHYPKLYIPSIDFFRSGSPITDFIESALRDMQPRYISMKFGGWVEYQ
jgi:hypothetical protein